MNIGLILGGALSLIASALHVAIIFGGGDWYRFFGAGEAMAVMAERGSPQPAIITAIIATGLGVFAAYAFAGAGWIRMKLPFLKPVLILICALYLIRGLAGLGLPFIVPQADITFWLVSSAICTVYGLAYVFGILAMPRQ
jgi:putative oxidoreductase